MGEPKPLASLSSSLLARKGHAAPAMRRQGAISLVHGGMTPDSFDPVHDDLGWNDMGDSHDPEHVTQPSGLSPMNGHAAHAAMPVAPHIVPMSREPADFPDEDVEIPAIVRQQQDLVRDAEATFVPRVAAAPKAPRAAPGSKGKAAFTLRLDAERHLQLRLVCAVDHRSAQQIVTQALDDFLAAHPSVVDLAGAASRRKSAN
jgi:hypothetical protein